MAPMSTALVQRIDRIDRLLLVVLGTELDPSLDHEDLTVGEIRRAIERHSSSGDACRAFQFLNQVAVARVVGDDAYRARFLQTSNADERRVRRPRKQHEPSGRIPPYVGV